MMYSVGVLQLSGKLRNINILSSVLTLTFKAHENRVPPLSGHSMFAMGASETIGPRDPNLKLRGPQIATLTQRYLPSPT
jgi:hypothetical protein